MLNYLSQFCRFPLPGDDVKIPKAAQFPVLYVSDSSEEVRQALIEFLGKNGIAFVGDADTTAAAQPLTESLPGERIVFPKGVTPRRANIDYLTKRIAHMSGVLAIGTGTINDICKAACRDAGKPYVILPTGLSMNGFCSANASIIENNGKKQSVAASPPLAAILHMQTLRAAPKRLWRSGLADVMCYPSCRFDWALSHFLTDSPYDESLFDMLRPYVVNSPEDVSAVARGDDAALLRLALALFISGAGMNVAGGSMPASQSEHLLCHAYDMLKPRNALLHGEKIAAATARSLALQRGFLKQNVVFSAKKYAAHMSARMEKLSAEPAFAPHIPVMRQICREKTRRLSHAPQEMQDRLIDFKTFFHSHGATEHKKVARLYHSCLYPDRMKTAVIEREAVRLAAPLLRDRITIEDMTPFI